MNSPSQTEESNNFFQVNFSQMHSILTYLMDLMYSLPKQKSALIENHIESDLI